MTTTRPEFDSALTAGPISTVLRTVFVDAVSPVALFSHLTNSQPGTFLLESAEQGGIWSRYSFIGLSSWGCLTETNGSTAWIDYGLSADDAFGADIPRGRLDALDVLYRRWSSPSNTNLPPLTTGLVGFLGWDTVREIENLPDRPQRESEVPEQSMVFVRDILVMDHRTSEIHVCTAVINDGDPDDLWSKAQRRIDDIVTRLTVAIPLVPMSPPENLTGESVHRTSQAEFIDSVDAAKEYVRNGDVFQVVLSQRFDTKVSASAVDVYRMLRALNPSPYMYLLCCETADQRAFEIVGSSPEALVKTENGRAFSHPIAGSRPRGATPEEDAAFAESLARDEKEQAEHLMLVDLARNDLARVCVPGSVEVTEFMSVERFSHIMHLVSSIEGDVAAGVSPLDVFRATFPAGTLSGAPKPRALQIIDELEPASRGVYGGAVGYVGFGGDADLAIAIRTTVMMNGKASVQAGAGLVADSVPETEYEETLSKAAAPLRAIATANALRPALE